MILDDGSRPTLTLLFQFKDGLFARFWSQYDEILRHSNRSVELPVRVNQVYLSSLLNPLRVLSLKGIRCLMDKATYSLPSGHSVPVDLTLRTIDTQGEYSIEDEQIIPDFSVAAKHLEWRLLTDNFGDALNTKNARKAAVDKFLETYQYSSHGEVGDRWDVGSDGAMLSSVVRLAPIWSQDTSLQAPTSIKQKMTRHYKARLDYEIYEIHDMTTPGCPDDIELDETPLATISITTTYTVILAPVWVFD